MTTPQPVKASGRGLKIVLAISLALNLAVAGVVGGTLLGRVGDPPRPAARDPGFGDFGRALSPADRAALRRAFEAEAPEMQGMRHERRTEVLSLLAALRAVPFDPQALRSALQMQDARARERLDLGQRLLADRLIAMTEAERAAFADRLQSALTRRPDEAGRRSEGHEGRGGHGRDGGHDDGARGD